MKDYRPRSTTTVQRKAQPEGHIGRSTLVQSVQRKALQKKADAEAAPAPAPDAAAPDAAATAVPADAAPADAAPAAAAQEDPAVAAVAAADTGGAVDDAAAPAADAAAAAETDPAAAAAVEGETAAPPADAAAAAEGETAAPPADAAAVQMRADAPAATSSEDVQAAAAEGVSGPGGAMPHGAAIQAAFGRHDISGVTAHTDDKAAAASEAMGAEAFATGNDVAFAGGAPSLHTAAHEAAHVVQQKEGVHLSGGVGAEGDAYEQHADAVADAVVAGQSAEGLLDAGPGGGGGGGGVQRAVQRAPKPAAPPAAPPPAPPKPAAAAPKSAAPASAAPAGASAAAAPAAPKPPEKSKHGAGPAPGGWQGKVRGTVPSEAVTSDDPGHTYHVLDDDKVVATTEPVLLAPGSAVSKRATATKPKAEQEIIAACQRFEITIGNAMAGIANGSVQMLMERVKNYLEAKVKPYKDDHKKVEEVLKQLGGDLSQQWAGRIPKDMDAIQGVLDGGGNIREAITLFNNFVGGILKTDLANGLPSGAMSALLGEVQGLPGDAATRNAAALALFNQRRTAAQANVNAVTGTWKDNKPETPGQQGETRTDSIQAPVAATDNPIAGATHGGDAAGVPNSDGRYAAPTAGGKRENDSWWLHGMTVEEFTALGGVLSPTEKKLFNEGVYRQALAARKASIVDEASFQKAVQEAEAEAKKYVPWAAGFMGYDLKWDSANAVNDAFKKLSVPVGAGVSGTTARTMQSMGAVGIDSTTGLKICLGYLLPIQAHSFSEIRQAAAQMGAGGYTPKRGSHNYNQAPIKGDIEGMAGWAEFDRLYSPAAIGDTAATS